MDYKKYNDYELVYMVREKDDDSYGVLFDKYLPIIRRIASDYYKSYSTYGYDLDDFIQEGYIGFQQAVNYYDENKNALFYTFVIICIHRKILSFCKRITCESKNISNDLYVDLDEISLKDNFPLLEDYFSDRELYYNIWDIIYSFPFDYYCVFELRMNHFHYHEIFDLLEIPVRKAQFMVKKIQDKIRKEYVLYV